MHPVAKLAPKGVATESLAIVGDLEFGGRLTSPDDRLGRELERGLNGAERIKIRHFTIAFEADPRSRRGQSRLRDLDRVLARGGTQGGDLVDELCVVLAPGRACINSRRKIGVDAANRVSPDRPVCLQRTTLTRLILRE